MRPPPGLGRVVLAQPQVRTEGYDWADLELGNRFGDQKHLMRDSGSVELAELWLCSFTH